MKNALVSYLKTGNTFYGVEHTLCNDEECLYAFGLKKAKRKLDIIFTDTFKELSNISKQIGKAVPVFLIINTPDVLIKKVNSTDDNIKILNEAFPNLNKDEFYYEVLRQSKNAFVSICRKEVVDSILKKYQEASISVIDFSLGALVVSNNLKFINNTESVFTSNAMITLHEHEIEAINKQTAENNETYNINGLKVDSQYLLSCSGALTSALRTSILSGNNIERHLDLKEDFKQKRIFKLASRASLAVILSILLINFLVFNHYFNAVNALKDTSQILTSSRDKVTNLTAKILKSKKMVEDVQRSSGSKTTYFINDIISELPNTITLGELNYQPLLKRVEQEKPIEHTLNQILVKGNSMDSDEFSRWLAALERLIWVSEVNIVSYENSSKNKSDFSITIKIDETGKA